MNSCFFFAVGPLAFTWPSLASWLWQEHSRLRSWAQRLRAFAADLAGYRFASAELCSAGSQPDQRRTDGSYGIYRTEKNGVRAYPTNEYGTT